MTRGAGCGRVGRLAMTLGLLLLAPGPTVRADDDPAAGADHVPAGTAAPAAAAAAAGGGRDVTVQVTRGEAGLEVEGRCPVDAPATVAWQVLTDYDGIRHFVPSMRESRVTERADGHLLVEQVAVGRMLLFSRRFRTTLLVEEVPPTTIRFEDVLRRDFESYRGEWRIEERPGGVEIVYRVGARPSFSVPDFVARGVFRRTARDLLAQVRAEIERRWAMQGQAAPAGEPVQPGPKGS